MVMVDDDVRTIVCGYDSEIEEILQISLKDVNIATKEMDYCSQ